MSAAAWEPSPVSRLAGALAEIDAGFDESADAPLWTLSDADVSELVTLAHREVCRAQGLLTALIGEASARGIPGVAGSPSAVQWLRARLRMAPGEAATYARTAQRIRSVVPATGEALTAGSLSLAQAAAIGQAVADLGDDVPADAVAAAEALLLTQAATDDPVVLARVGVNVGAIVDPDGQDARDAESLRKADERAARLQAFSMSPDGAGGSYLRGHLDPIGAETVRAALDPLAAPRPTGPEGPDRRTADRRRADALVELARRALNLGDLPTAGGERPTVIVTMSLETLLDKIGTAMLPSGERISAAHARSMACDCDLVPAVLGAKGQVLDVGRSRRRFTGGVRKAIILRDRGCAHPGCDRPAAWCDCHHIIHWADGGETSLANGVLLCTFHHPIHDRGEWQIFIDPIDGLPTFIPPKWIDPEQKPLRNNVHPRPG